MDIVESAVAVFINFFKSIDDAIPPSGILWQGTAGELGVTHRSEQSKQRECSCDTLLPISDMRFSVLGILFLNSFGAAETCFVKIHSVWA